MLRASLRSTIALGSRPSATNVGPQWRAIQAGRSVSGTMRGYADKASIKDSKPIVLPGSASATVDVPPPPGLSTTPITKVVAGPDGLKLPKIDAQDVPLTPPTPAAVKAAPPPSSPPPPSTALPPPPPPPKPRRKFFRKFLTTLFLLSALGYGGGVYYSRINDNFHDFFTEYVPFGEDAVLYFEEKEFRKKFPAIANRTAVGKPRDTGELTQIPSKSGVSWTVSDSGSGRYSDATKQNGVKPGEAASASSKPVAQVEKAKVDATAAVAKPTLPVAKAEPPAPAKPNHPVTREAAPSPQIPAAAAPVPATPSAPAPKFPDAISFTVPEVDQPSKFPPEVARIDPLTIKDTQEPLVEDLVKIVNAIIATINADNASLKYSSTISNAKSEIAKVGDKIKSLKSSAEKEANSKIEATHQDFDRAAKELIRRLEGEMQQQETQWKEEYESERQKLQKSYEERIKSEMARASEVHEQRLRNELLEQALEMKKKFTSEVKTRVEEERDGRLGKLTELSSTVNELEKLTTEWNSVVDQNLKTQHLHVAVEAVRSNLENSQVPRPFIKELAALKEIAAADPVVDAAIASINPTAYQKGVPSSAQLVDRFRRVATEVRKASLLPEEAGVASHASSWVLSKLLFKKKGLATGTDVESILTRTEILLEEGDLDGAAREMNGLNGWAKTLSRDWLGEVRKVLEVQQALDVIATEARLQSLRVE